MDLPLARGKQASSFAVFGDGAPRDIEAVPYKHVRYLLVRERLCLVLSLNVFAYLVLHNTIGYLFPSLLE